jgi:hypothetical protein
MIFIGWALFWCHFFQTKCIILGGLLSMYDLTILNPFLMYSYHIYLRVGQRIYIIRNRCIKWLQLWSTWREKDFSPEANRRVKVTCASKSVSMTKKHEIRKSKHHLENQKGIVSTNINLTSYFQVGPYFMLIVWHTITEFFKNIPDSCIGLIEYFFLSFQMLMRMWKI